VRYAVENARLKALSAFDRVRAGFVVGVDTVVVVKDVILGKPETVADARAMLVLLSGRTHAVVSGVAVAVKPGDRVLTGSETSMVTFRELQEKEIQRYVASGEPLDKAGAYAIQGLAASFITRVSGSYLNIVGLPAYGLLVLLDKAGFRS
jgi:septum formation protein